MALQLVAFFLLDAELSFSEYFRETLSSSSMAIPLEEASFSFKISLVSDLGRPSSSFTIFYDLRLRLINYLIITYPKTFFLKILILFYVLIVFFFADMILLSLTSIEISKSPQLGLSAHS